MKADGSSTVFPITAAAAEGFSNAYGTPVNVWISGTGGGFRRFCSGETDISSASRPIKENEAALCRANGVEYIEVPVAYDGLAVLVNPKNTWAESITTGELERIWKATAQGQVMQWSQVREGWPERALHLYGPGAASGTYDYFAAAIMGREASIRVDYIASEDDTELVEHIASDELGLGFFGLGYYEENRARLKLLAVDDGNSANGSGPIAPSAATVTNGTYQPLSRPLFIYLADSTSARSEPTAFASYYLDHAPELVSKVGYIPLPAAAYALAQQRIEARRTGTLFEGGGSQIGISIEELLQRERGGQD